MLAEGPTPSTVGPCRATATLRMPVPHSGEDVPVSGNGSLSAPVIGWLMPLNVFQLWVCQSVIAS